MRVEEKRSLIEQDVRAYTTFNIAGLIATGHPEVISKKRSDFSFT